MFNSYLKNNLNSNTPMDLFNKFKSHISEHPIEHQSAFIGIGAGLIASSFQTANKSALFGIIVAAIAYFYLNSTNDLYYNNSSPSSSSVSSVFSSIVSFIIPSSKSEPAPEKTCPSCPAYAIVTKCVSPDGSTVANLKCPLGKLIKVTSVFYGRDSALTCQLSQGGYPDPTIFTPAPSPPGALEAVKAICDGKNDATVPLNESTFGTDLYPNVSKYARIIYTCV